MKNKMREVLYKLIINKKHIVIDFFKATVMGVILYVLGVLLAGIELEISIGYKLYFGGIFILYMPFLLDKIFNKYEFSDKLKTRSYILNLIMSIIYSVYELISLNKIFIGFNNLFVYSILILLVNIIMKKFISKDKIQKIGNWGGVVILFVTGVIFLIK